MHPRTRRAAPVLTAALLAGAALTAQPATAAPANYFSSCTKLAKQFPAGVAKNTTAAARQVEEGNSRPAITAKAKKVYGVNEARLDRDKDGTAWEA